MGILIVCAIVGIIVSIIYAIRIKEYQEGSYYQVTNLPYNSMSMDLGTEGEYLIYQQLRYLESYGARFLFNVYIPKPDGTTTELDVVMICPKGIFVFESKNYSGWIFGSEHQRYWYQTLPTGYGESHKEQFYNPIMQNRSHIKHLKRIIGEQIPVWSIIVFSDRCTLKSISISSNDVCVINRYYTSNVVSSIWNQPSQAYLSDATVLQLFNLLYPLTQVDDFVRAQHIANINNTVHNHASHHGAQNATYHQQQRATSQPNTTHTQTASPICPICGSKLMLWTSTQGATAGKNFYGCSNYPKCSYMRNYPEN